MDESLDLQCASPLSSMHTLSTLESHAVLVHKLGHKEGSHQTEDSTDHLLSQEYLDNETLPDKLQRLTLKRERLKKKLKPKVKSVAEVIAEQGGKGKNSNAEINEEELLKSLHKKQLVDLKLAYRLSGCSLSLVKDNRIRLSFDTSYKGEYFQTFYADLDIRDRKHVLKRHTLPAFFPRKTLETSLEQSVVQFVHTAQGLLQAYTTRRQEIMQLQSEYKEMLVGDVETTSACDFVSFCLRETGSLGCAVKITMLYTDFVSVLPTEVESRLPRKLELEGEEARQVLEIVEAMCDLLKTTPLITAIEKIMS